MTAFPRTDPASSVPRRPRRTPRVVPTAVPAAVSALAAYAAVRLTGLLLLCGSAALRDEDPLRRLNGRWDAVWYRRIAENGYGYEARLPDGSVHPDLAFFPLLPGLERLLAAASPLGAADAGLLVAVVSSLVAAWGIYAVGTHVAGHRAGVLLAALWGVLPTGFVQWMAYTESLFTALTAWSLHAALTGRWRTAGLLAAVAGLCRPTAAALLAALAAAGAAHLVVQARGGTPVGRLLRRNGRLLTGMLLAPLGWFAYMAYVGVHEGSPFGYFHVQAAWGNRIDGGAALAGFIWDLLTGPWPSPLGGAGVCAALGLVGALLVAAARQHQPPALFTYACAVVALSLVGAAYFGSRPRLMTPAFPLLLPLAAAMARWPAGRSAAVAATAALASGTYGAVVLLGNGPP
ncbi:hypothetical protein [Streptomyces sp. CMB-StM0423]|uniref:hypothetical protein n=1 Tax=Streptomyces sp. CMB-StM0423 TaxID=2059884 RepID=UPI000C706C73|nr:hypothetical protein [Streptomyces sp. CMB-StM0423]AUH39098.1 hypothetical protein CXR04_01480 [Streptomyces sp. CMB-StM0423]